MSDSNYVLSIAGFDPSSGAGVTQDIKTFEFQSVTGLGVCTALTIQNDISFTGVNWVSIDVVKQQIDVLFDRFEIEYVKIGLIESLSVLRQCVKHLLKKNNKVKIVWDPILSASAGFDFHTSLDISLLEDILFDIYLITPNLPEYERIFECLSKPLEQYCHVYLKGGHSESHANDVLFEGKNQFVFEGKKVNHVSKHGTGCVLSSLIVSMISKGMVLTQACQESKKYMDKYIVSNNTHLGRHFG